MDGMALLCTLHARGPTTLQRLRSAGVRELDELSSLHAEELGRIVDLPPAAARRLAREAGLLARRLGAVSPARADRARLEPSAPQAPPARREPWAPAFSPSSRPPAEGAEPQVELRPTRPPEAERTSPRPALSSYARPERGPDARGPDEPLRAGSVPGLTPEICDALARAGIQSAVQLFQAADLTLARRIGLSYPKLLDLAHGARTCFPKSPRSVNDPAPGAPMLQRVNTGCPSHEEVGAGGPFT